jgi:chromosome segregation ATPase
MSKRAYDQADYGNVKRHCFEVPHGQKRSRDDAMEECGSKRQAITNQQSGHLMEIHNLRVENASLRAELDSKERILEYGASEIKWMNAALLTNKHQIQMMEDYLANLQGNAVDMRISSY